MTAIPRETYRRRFDRVLERMGGLYDFDDVVERVRDGRMMSFVEGNSWALAQVQQFPKRRILEILIATGELKDARTLHDQVLKFADDEHCDVMTAVGRLGFLPDASRRGWRVKARAFVYQRELTR